ncbi:MAG: conjugal transfer protein TraD [Rickettsiaceae bacterium]|nr:conjugal transfer protein TraD [Rickettsiaceae bacterium]
MNSEEVKLKLRERKAKTRHLIETGGLVVKAGLGHLPNNALYGALLAIKEDLEQDELVMAAWIVKGDKALNREQKESIPVILSFETQPEKGMRDQIRSLGLKWNSFRSEWYGTIDDIELLKKLISNYKHSIEILND